MNSSRFLGPLIAFVINIYLGEKGIAVFPFKNERDGLQALVDTKIDAFVFDESVLKYLVRTQYPARVHVLPEIFDHY